LIGDVECLSLDMQFHFSPLVDTYLVYFNFQTLVDGDMALMDMGAEYSFYGSDITCSYPVSSLEYSYIYFDTLSNVY
jgi:hypothetical protein